MVIGADRGHHSCLCALTRPADWDTSPLGRAHGPGLRPVRSRPGLEGTCPACGRAVDVPMGAGCEPCPAPGAAAGLCPILARLDGLARSREISAGKAARILEQVTPIYAALV